MVNADLQVGDGANNKQARPVKDGNYCKVNRRKKGTVYFKIFHQNIRGLGKTAEELLSHLHPDFPHVLCPTEHHLQYLQLEKVHIENTIWEPITADSYVKKVV